MLSENYRIKETTVLFISVLKWSFLATFIGIIVGTSTAFFLRLLDLGLTINKTFPSYFFFLPLAFLFSAWIIKRFAPEAEGHGTEKVIEAVHQRSGKINVWVVPVKLVATLVTIISGGSAGKEGPCAQIGGGLASFFSDLFRFDRKDRKKLVICGISAGFASVFGTPIAGAIFGVEVLFIGSIVYEMLLPSIIAGIISYHVASGLGVIYSHNSITSIFSFSTGFFIEVIFAGVFFGLCSWILIKSLSFGKRLSRMMKISPLFKAFIGGLILVVLALVFSTDYLGLGINNIESHLAGEPSAWYEFILKTVFTSITLNFGGSGGIITPIFFIGSSSGAFFATLLGLDIPLFAAIGMVALLAGAANTPITASIMSIELFGPELGSYAALACIISFLITGHSSVYPSQILSIVKSSSIDVNTGGEISRTNPRIRLREKTASKILLNFYDKAEKMFKKK